MSQAQKLQSSLHKHKATLEHSRDNGETGCKVSIRDQHEACLARGFIGSQISKVCPSDLECSTALVILTLDVDIGFVLLAESGRVDECCFLDDIRLREKMGSPEDLGELDAASAAFVLLQTTQRVPSDLIRRIIVMSDVCRKTTHIDLTIIANTTPTVNSPLATPSKWKIEEQLGSCQNREGSWMSGSVK